MPRTAAQYPCPAPVGCPLPSSATHGTLWFPALDSLLSLSAFLSLCLLFFFLKDQKPMIFAGFYSRRCVGDQAPVQEGGGLPSEDRDGAAGARI